MKFTRKKLIFLSILCVTLGLAFQKVFSINWTQPSPGFSTENQALLLTQNSEKLSEEEQLKILSKLNRLVVTSYRVKNGEWLEKIAKKVGIQPSTLRSTNHLEDPYLYINQKLILPNKDGMVHIVDKDEPLESIITKYEKWGGDRKSILANNSLDDLIYFREGKIYLKGGSKLWIPNAKRHFPYLAKPVNWSRISSRFGVRRHPVLKTKRRHDGYDMVAPYGSKVYASEGGTVLYAGWRGHYGKMVEIRHYNGLTTRYGHLSKIDVQKGQKVRKKQMIGRVGSTGLSTGPHLHFEVRKNSDGTAVRPGKYLY
jgi:murein DD-endopeptidase MepM/ murein hydrolase activator NlpD